MPTTPVSGQASPQRRGRPITAAGLNRAGDAAWQNLLQLGPGGAPGGRTAGGSFLYPIPSPPSHGGTPAATIFPPWYPFLTQDIHGNWQANFFPGTVAGIMPTLSSFTALALTQSAVNYIYLACTATGANVTAATITASTTYPTLAAANSGSPPTAFNIPIAVVDLTVAGTPVIYNLVGFGNIWVQPYAALFDTINTAALLTPAFTPWYNWEWGAGQD